jgi:CubicO group peptidase (beta-lactamase class C family)
MVSRLSLLFCILGILLSGCSVSSPTPSATKNSATVIKADYWPSNGWKTSRPEDQQMDSQKLAQMVEAAGQPLMNIHSILVIRHGYLVSETYFTPYKAETQHELQSITKSFMATLVGIAIDKGYINSVSYRVLDFFPGRTFKNQDSRKAAMTLEDLLTMRSGLDWDESLIQQIVYQSDWVQSTLDLPMKSQPGTEFNYCTMCTHVVSAILKQATGMSALDFAKKELLGPLGITNYTWPADPQNISYGGFGLKLTPRDMAKLGFLYLNQGVWDGKQIVSSAWVKSVTQMHVNAGTRQGLNYGYQWWIYPRFGAYAALGYDGQTVFVVPDLDLVIVATAQTVGHEHDEIFNLIDNYIIPAVRES